MGIGGEAAAAAAAPKLPASCLIIRLDIPIMTPWIGHAQHCTATAAAAADDIALGVYSDAGMCRVVQRINLSTLSSLAKICIAYFEAPPWHITHTPRNCQTFNARERKLEAHTKQF